MRTGKKPALGPWEVQFFVWASYEYPQPAKCQEIQSSCQNMMKGCEHIISETHSPLNI